MSDTPRRATSRLSFFGPANAPSLKESEMMHADRFAPPGMITPYERELLRQAESVRVLFRQADSDGFSLVHVTFAPNYMLPRHSHDVDCVYYVLCGEVVLGRRVVGAGAGFFVPKDQPYAYQAGPDGVELLEFRHATSFDYVVHEQNPARWRAIVDAVRPESLEPAVVADVPMRSEPMRSEPMKREPMKSEAMKSEPMGVEQR